MFTVVISFEGIFSTKPHMISQNTSYWYEKNQFLAMFTHTQNVTIPQIYAVDLKRQRMSHRHTVNTKLAIIIARNSYYDYC